MQKLAANRRVKNVPPLYIADPGILHSLLGLRAIDDLEGHPKVGASWEGFALGEVVRALNARPHECFHWAKHTGAELDLLVVRGNRRLGFEFKLGLRHRLERRLRLPLAGGGHVEAGGRVRDHRAGRGEAALGDGDEDAGGARADVREDPGGRHDEVTVGWGNRGDRAPRPFGPAAVFRARRCAPRSSAAPPTGACGAALQPAWRGGAL
jgi:hypothetical protein